MRMGMIDHKWNGTMKTTAFLAVLVLTFAGGCQNGQRQPANDHAAVGATTNAVDPPAKIEIKEELWGDGTPRMRREGITLEDGTFVSHGLTTLYWDSGKKKTQITFVDGVRHGPRFSWYQNGALWIEGEFVDGGENGTWTSWYPDGTKASERNFDHGAFHGRWTEWHRSGKMKDQFSYVKGKIQGTRTIWDEDGNMIRKMEYHDGEPLP